MVRQASEDANILDNKWTFVITVYIHYCASNVKYDNILNVANDIVG